MKYFTKGIAAVSIAVLIFSFTAIKTESLKQTNYVWFEVKTGTGILCNNFTQVTPADLQIVVARTSGVSTALGDLQAAGYRLTQADAAVFFGCSITENYVCAVGYSLVESSFEITVIDGVTYWVPKSSIVEQIKICRSQI